MAVAAAAASLVRQHVHTVTGATCEGQERGATLTVGWPKSMQWSGRRLNHVAGVAIVGMRVVISRCRR